MKDRRATDAKYTQSEKGKARVRRYRQSAKGRASNRASVDRYQATTAGILSVERAIQKRRTRV